VGYVSETNFIYWDHAGHWSGTASQSGEPEGWGSLAVLGDGTSLFVATPSGLVVRSRDGGASWQHIDSGNPNQETKALLAVPEIDGIVAAKASVQGFEWEGADGVFLSQDDGETWTDLYKVIHGIEEGARVFAWGHILAVSPMGGLSIGVSQHAQDDIPVFNELATGPGWRYIEGHEHKKWADWVLDDWQRSGYEISNFALNDAEATIRKTDFITALAISDKYRFSANSREHGILRAHWWNRADDENDEPVVVRVGEELKLVTAMAVTPDASILYAVAAGILIYSSTDLGETWEAVDDFFCFLKPEQYAEQYISMITLSEDGKLDWIGLQGKTSADFYRRSTSGARESIYHEFRARQKVEKDLQNTEAELDKAKAKAAADAAGLNGLIADAKSSLAELQAKYDTDLKTANDAYSALQDSSDAKLEEAAQHYDALSKKYDADVARLMAAITRLTDQLGAGLNGLIADLKARDVTLAEVKDDLNGQINGLNATISTQSDTITSQDTVIKVKGTKIDQLTLDLSTEKTSAASAAKKAAAALVKETDAKELAQHQRDFVRDTDLQALLPQVSAKDLDDLSGQDHGFSTSSAGLFQVVKSPQLPGNPAEGLTVAVWVNPTQAAQSTRSIHIEQGDLQFDLGVSDAAQGQVFVQITTPALKYTSFSQFIPVGAAAPWVFCLRPDNAALLPELYSDTGGALVEFRGKEAGQGFGGANRMNIPLPIPPTGTPISVAFFYPVASSSPFSSLRIYSRALSVEAIQRTVYHGQFNA
jgi:hypothetical protein